MAVKRILSKEQQDRDFRHLREFTARRNDTADALARLANHCDALARRVAAMSDLLPRIRSSLKTIRKFADDDRRRLSPAGLDGAATAVAGIAIEALGWIDRDKAATDAAATPQEADAGEESP